MVKTILLIGKTGSGKSTLANVISGTSKFKESESSISTTKEIQSEEFEENNTSYRVIDTVGIGDTQLTGDEVLDKIAEAIHLARDGINQVFFVIDGRFDQNEMSIYNLLKTIIFDQSVINYTTMVRTNFDNFRTKSKCDEDIDLMIGKGDELAEAIESCQRRVIHVDNPSIDAEDSNLAYKKRSRNKSRQKMLSHLSEICRRDPYNPPQLKKLSEGIAEYMEESLKKKKELQEKKDSFGKTYKTRRNKWNINHWNSKNKQWRKKKDDEDDESHGASVKDNNAKIIVEEKKEQVESKQEFKKDETTNFKQIVQSGIAILENEIKELKIVKRLKEKIQGLEEKIREIVRRHILNNYEGIIRVKGGETFIKIIKENNVDSSLPRQDFNELRKKKEECEKECQKQGYDSQSLDEIEDKIKQSEKELLDLKKELLNYEEVTEEWQKQGFSVQQAQEWAGILGRNFDPENDFSFCAWLQNSKKISAEKVLSNEEVEKLRNEYNPQQKSKPEETRAILLIGRTGNGKSTLANVLINKNNNFEEVFKESGRGASETRKISDKVFEINEIKYRIIDTPGLGDTRLTKIETLREIAKVYDKVKEGLSQILFVNSGRLTPEEVETYNLLKEVLFDEDITKYTTIVRTKFDNFEDEEECRKDIQSLLAENNKAITEMIESCNKKIVHVNNPPINLSGSGLRIRRQINLNKEIREVSREKLLNHLASCDEIYKPEGTEVLNKIELKERYKAFGLCEECNKINTWYRWCKSCSERHFTEEFKNWSGGNPAVDEFIQRYQRTAINKYGVLEWIPYEKFRDIEYLAEGGFGKVYKAAEWIDRQISYWNVKDNNWERDKFYPDGVVLKSLTNSQNITSDFLREVAYYKLFKDEYDGVVKCFGISQDPQTKDYIMVMDYTKNGDLRKYLTNYYKKLDFHNKLGQLYHLAKGLNNIHRQGLIHRDIHPGNILISNSEVCLITDLGLCRPVNETDKEEKIYGVLPYVAPEVLQDKVYTQAADIYSWGIVVYELFTGCVPYHEFNNEQLAYKICQGLRPNFTKLLVPKLLENLIKQCLDADPLKRPTASELFEITNAWQNEIKDKKDTEFYRQYQEIEELTPQSNVALDYQVNSRATYTSQLLDTDNLPEPQNSQEINEQFYELYSQYGLEEKVEDWINIHDDFHKEDIKKRWTEKFMQGEIKEWFNSIPSLNPAQDYEFVLWLRDTKQMTPSNNLNSGGLEQLKQEYQACQQQPQILQKKPLGIPSSSKN